ncbi:ComE operon protein 2 [Thalassobacillus sp. CUG 92003]|uniref:ComE operon protein 2 n=1 Tax=Thalassobacillus sp. CUG 92003 TaxID=2736641 RepID=UPI0015E668B1|nr:ComE operon protein 2 [Thalassobacillus sp. CUG 92003]
MKRLSWDQYFMAQSHLLKLRSTCERLSVGATIVREKRMIAGGYNGSVSGGVHCIDQGCYVIDGHCVRTIHAEMNALLQCSKFGVPTEGAELYVTHFPCIHCTKALIQAGIKAVYYSEDYKNHPYAIELFQQAEVTVEKVPLEDPPFEQHRTEKKAYMHYLIRELEQSNRKDLDIPKLKQDIEHLYADTDNQES